MRYFYTITCFIIISLSVRYSSIYHPFFIRKIQISKIKKLFVIGLNTCLIGTTYFRLIRKGNASSLQIDCSRNSCSVHRSFLSRLYIYRGQVIGLHIGSYWVHLICTSSKNMHPLNCYGRALGIHIIQ